MSRKASCGMLSVVSVVSCESDMMCECERERKRECKCKCDVAVAQRKATGRFSVDDKRPNEQEMEL